MSVTIKQIEDALWATGGFITQAAKKLNISQPALSQRIKRSERLQELRAQIEESLLDLTETKLMAKINNGNLGAICFYLKCKGKHRGYVEKQQLEHTGSNSGPIQTVRLDAEQYAAVREQMLKEDDV